MALVLTARDVTALEGRTEGWIAALQLAALSMQGREDLSAFIAGFSGDDRYIVDFLVEEVLQLQPGHVQLFLLQTSILDRLSGPFCDAVTGQDGGQAMLAALERGNLFLVPLDDVRQWYRYHQLFADVLQARLLDEQPGVPPGLHRRASVWYEQNGEPSKRSDTHWPPGFRASGGPGRVGDSGDAQDQAGGRSPWLAQTLPDELVRPGPCSALGCPGRCWRMRPRGR